MAIECDGCSGCRQCPACGNGGNNSWMNRSPPSCPQKYQRMRHGYPARISDLNVAEEYPSNYSKTKSDKKKRKKKIHSDDSTPWISNEPSNCSRSPPACSDIIAALNTLATALKQGQMECCCNSYSNELPKVPSYSKNPSSAFNTQKKISPESMQQCFPNMSYKNVGQNSYNLYGYNTPPQSDSNMHNANYQYKPHYSGTTQSTTGPDDLDNYYQQKMPEETDAPSVCYCCCCCCCRCNSNPEDVYQEANPPSQESTNNQSTKQSSSILQLNCDEFAKCMGAICTELKRMQTEKMSNTERIQQKDDNDAKCKCCSAFQNEPDEEIAKQEEEECPCPCYKAAKTTVIYERPNGIVKAEGSRSMTALMNDWNRNPMPDDAQQQRARENANISEHKRSVKAAIHRAIEQYSKSDHFDEIAKAIANEEAGKKPDGHLTNFCDMLMKITEKKNEDVPVVKQKSKQKNQTGTKDKKNRSRSPSRNPRLSLRSRPYSAYGLTSNPPPNLIFRNMIRKANCCPHCNNGNVYMGEQAYPTRCPQKCSNTINMQAYCCPFDTF